MSQQRDQQSGGKVPGKGGADSRWFVGGMALCGLMAFIGSYTRFGR